MKKKINNFLSKLLSIKYPIITEKSTQQKENNNIYTFIIDKKLTKTDIKKIFETVFHIKILSVKTLILLKRKKNKKRIIYAKYKKAYIKLEKEHVIPNIF